MNQAPLHEYKFPIKPGPVGVFQGVIGGNFFYVTRATHPNFRVALNDGTFLAGSFARGHRFNDDTLIEKIHVINDDPLRPLEVTVLVGKGDPIDHLFNAYKNEVIPQPTRLYAQTAGKIAANSQVDLTGVYLTTDIRRKSIQVSNLDSTLWVELLDSVGNPALRIRPLDNITLDIAGKVSVRNSNAAEVACYISEIIFCEESPE